MLDNSNNPQGVGSNYNRQLFLDSQKIGWSILNELQNHIEEGQTEADAKTIYSEILKKNNIEKNWHPPKIRFGPNSIKSFRQLSNEEYKIKKNDIFFLDIGPIINGYEADIGKTFILNKNETLMTDQKLEYQRIINDSETLFNLTKNKFLSENLSGPELYNFAETEAKKRGWIMVEEGANGHRIGDFPHHIFYKGNLKDFPDSIIPGLWILEIQLNSPDLSFGSFFEDVL